MIFVPRFYSLTATGNWVTGLVAILLLPSALFAQTASFTAMTFAEAAQPYTTYAYHGEGHVRRDGTLFRNALGCSGYASAVLQRMHLGENWLRNRDYKHELYQWRGSRMAAYYGIDLTALLTLGQLEPAEVRRLIQGGVLKANGLYLFSVTRPTVQQSGVWVAPGHVGFIRVREDGSLIQSHYSGIRPYQGLASGDFRDWYERSQYRAQPVELYFLKDTP